MNSRDKKLSIIIATFNAGAELKECLESIKSVGLNDYEIVLSDGASTDNTEQIARSFSTLPIIWNSRFDKGIYDALNKGIDLSRGRWLYFLGSDDRLLPGFANIVAALTSDNTVYYGVSEEYHSGPPPDFELITGEFSNYKLAKYCLNHQSILYPYPVFLKYRYDLAYKVFADYALNIKVWGDRSFQKIFVNESIVRYHMSGFSSVNKDEVFKGQKALLIRESMGMGVYVRYLLKKYRKVLAGEKDWY